MLTVVKCLKIHSLSFLPITIFFFCPTYFHPSPTILTFLPFIFSFFSHVLFPFHSFLLVIFNCATSTLPNYMPPTERKKCTHFPSPPLSTPYHLIILSSPISLCGHPTHPLFFHPCLDNHSSLCILLYLL